MILTLDVGSTLIFGGLLKEGEVILTFQKSTHPMISADELGLFLKTWLTVKDYGDRRIEGIVFCSVVPEMNPVVVDCGREYFGVEPMTLQAGVKSGLKIKYSNHRELGADLIANAVAAVGLHASRNLIIVDFGTATSLCAVSDSKEYLGGTLVPGLDIAMNALADRTARLPVVEIQPVTGVCGRDAVSGIQGGLYYGTLGMLKELIGRMRQECFPDREVTVVATGRYAHLYEKFRLFDHHVPELVLLGLEQIRILNLD